MASSLLFSSPTLHTTHFHPTIFSSPTSPAYSCPLKMPINHGRVVQFLKTSKNQLTLVRASSVDDETNQLPDDVPDQQPVSVPVSPSDLLTMFFQAEGTMSETAILTVTKALEEAGGITNLKVQVLEGIASVELTKQTTIQATGVASSLIEIIQGSGFKLQTLNLSFEDEEEVVVA